MYVYILFCLDNVYSCCRGFPRDQHMESCAHGNNVDKMPQQSLVRLGFLHPKVTTPLFALLTIFLLDESGNFKSRVFHKCKQHCHWWTLGICAFAKVCHANLVNPIHVYRGRKGGEVTPQL